MRKLLVVVALLGACSSGPKDFRKDVLCHANKNDYCFCCNTDGGECARFEWAAYAIMECKQARSFGFPIIEAK
ncbi:SusD family [Leptospira johnsonii]|uniref:SusD family n=1 Tax=Leptospira johnsonii TaxID=1917820 RepID=A0A2P2D7R8_9LEPT|nr:SusD family [Leptospira johnsonii]